MENNVYQILLTGGSIGILYAIYLIIKVIFGKFKVGGDTNYQKMMAQNLNTISENHLHGIEQAIKEQTTLNHEDHDRQTGVLIEIRTILGERK